MNINYRKQYKMMYPDNQLFYISFEDNEFIFRNITKKEFMDLKELATTDLDFEDLICQLAIISPKDIDFYTTGKGGLSTTLFPLIIQNSDLQGNSIDKKFIEYRQMILNSSDEQYKAIIKSVFPEFTYDIIDSWPYDKVMLYLTRAEFILKNIHGKDPKLEIVSDNNQKDIEEQEIPSEIEQENMISWNLIQKGIDPIMLLWGPNIKRDDELPRPFIGSYHWRNEGIMNAIAKQIHKRISN